MSEIKAVPVFTQEMSDNGEIPSVGMMFQCGAEFESDSRLVDFNGSKVKVIGISSFSDGKVITFSHETRGIGCGMFSKEWVKPPIELVDGAAYMFDSHKNNLLDAIGVYSKVHDTLTTFKNLCAARDCTNIRLMTVESK